MLFNTKSSESDLCICSDGDYSDEVSSDLGLCSDLKFCELIRTN